MTPFPLDGGRAGDGGESPDLSGHPHRPPKLKHAPGAVARARHLRREMTVGEKALWQALRKLDLNVRRQVPIGRYIADFAIHAAKLIVEVDGPHHDEPERQLRDLERMAWLERQGYRVLRVPERRAREEAETVAEEVRRAVLSPPSPALPPSRGKGGF